MLKQVSLEEVRLIAFDLARQHLSFDEPMPDFDTRFPNILESCLATPFQQVFGHSPYPNLIAQASVLFYLLVKNHPFQNGNKRIAIVVLLVFLAKHNKWVRIDRDRLYKFTLWVAESKAKDMSFVLPSIQAFISTHLVPFPS